jgi:hypothetical protein
MLTPDVFDSWLSADQNVEQFDRILAAKISVSLTAAPIDKPSTFNHIGEPVLIAAD